MDSVKDGVSEILTTAEKTMAQLCSDLGDGIRPLSLGEFNALKKLVISDTGMYDLDADITESDLERIGYSDPKRILSLLNRPFTEKIGIAKARIITRLSPHYPQSLISKLGDDAPTVLYYYGNKELFSGKHVSLVGMRQCSREGLEFAAKVGELVAKEGKILVSGGARGADSEAENAALRSGGCVVSFLTASISVRLGQNEAKKYCEQGRLLLVCSQYPYLSFSAKTALLRNKYIHSISERVYVSDCGKFTGGTWAGTMQNIRNKWSNIYVFDNGMEGNNELIKAGCKAILLDES